MFDEKYQLKRNIERNAARQTVGHINENMGRKPRAVALARQATSHARSGFILLSLMVLFLALFATRAMAVEIKEVTSKSGIKAYLVEDYTLPIISLSFSFDGGTIQDTLEKPGVVRLMTALLDEGAGDLDSVAFRSKLEELGIDLGFSAGRESITGSVRTITSESDTAFEMLRLALNEPRFETEAIERMRNAIRLGIIRSKTSPDAVGSLALREVLFGAHPYSRSASGTEESIETITRDDITTAHKRLFARDNMFVGVVGAISEDELKAALDKIFSDLPEKATLAPVEETNPSLGESKAISMPVPNASIRLIYAGLKRNDPDFFAAHLMNHIFGGGSFSSRLYKAVREEQGLVYGVSSGLATFDHSAYLAIGTSTRAENQEKTINVIKQEIATLLEKGISQEELDTARKYVLGSYAINNLDSSSKIARVLVTLQSENLGKDYLTKREQQISAVTLEDVNRLAQKLLGVEPTILTVGPATQ